MVDRTYLLPVLRGTVRKGARTGPVADLVVERLVGQPDVETRLIRLEDLEIPSDDEGTGIKNSRFSDLIERSDGLVIVAPEYNHGYPSSLKHALDTNYAEYVHKPVGLVGVSSGVLGGARMIENLLPVLRAVGLVPLQRDATVGNVGEAFDESGALRDERVLRRIDGMLAELRWMAATLRYGREHIAAGGPAPATTCRDCTVAMNRHAGSVNEAAGGASTNVYTCPSCGGSRAVPV